MSKKLPISSLDDYGWQARLISRGGSINGVISAPTTGRAERRLRDRIARRASRNGGHGHD